MELIPSREATSRSAAQGLSNILWNPKVHHHVHKGPPLVPTLNQLKKVHATPSYLRSVLISSSHLRLRLFSVLFPYDFPTKALYAFLFFPCVLHPLHIFVIDLFILFSVGEEYKL
jgi:hypothetical protein